MPRGRGGSGPSTSPSCSPSRARMHELARARGGRPSQASSCSQIVAPPAREDVVEHVEPRAPSPASAGEPRPRATVVAARPLDRHRLRGHAPHVIGGSTVLVDDGRPSARHCVRTVTSPESSPSWVHDHGNRVPGSSRPRRAQSLMSSHRHSSQVGRRKISLPKTSLMISIMWRLIFRRQLQHSAPGAWRPRCEAVDAAGWSRLGKRARPSSRG